MEDKENVAPFHYILNQSLVTPKKNNNTANASFTFSKDLEIEKTYLSKLKLQRQKVSQYLSKTEKLYEEYTKLK